MKDNKKDAKSVQVNKRACPFIRKVTEHITELPLLFIFTIRQGNFHKGRQQDNKTTRQQKKTLEALMSSRA